jgi:cytochrome c biogenesis protein CcmG/thiol:disulfide interchange protein DsbE
MRRVLYFLPVLLFVALAVYFGISLRPGYDPHELPSAMLDKPAPAFDLPGLNGKGFSRDGLSGQVVVINFFASWCVPCRVEHPILMRLAQERQVALYGVAYKDKPEDANRLLTRSGDPYRQIGMDRDGTVGLDFGVYGVPETYVLDKHGTIRKRFVGPLTDEAVASELLPLLSRLNGS